MMITTAKDLFVITYEINALICQFGEEIYTKRARAERESAEYHEPDLQIMTLGDYIERVKKDEFERGREQADEQR